jgi:hypothetical protein
MKNKDHSRLANSDWRTDPIAQAPGRPFFSKSIAQRKSTDSPLNAIESEYECSSSESATSPREQKPYFLTGRNKRKAWFFTVLQSQNFFIA